MEDLKLNHKKMKILQKPNVFLLNPKLSNTDALNIRNCEVEAYIPEGLEIIRAYEESYDKITEFIRKTAQELNITGYNEKNHKGELRHIVYRYSKSKNECIVI